MVTSPAAQIADCFAGDAPAIFVVVAPDQAGVAAAQGACAAHQLELLLTTADQAAVVVEQDPPAHRRFAICLPPASAATATQLAVQLGVRHGIDRYVPMHASAAGLSCGAERTFAVPPDLDAVELERWQQTTARLLWEEACLAGYDFGENVPTFLVSCAQRHGLDLPVFAQDLPTPVTLSFKLLLRAVFALGAELVKKHEPGERVGLLLPTSAGTAAVFYATMMAGLVPVMLNFSAGSSNLRSACATAQVRTVYTAAGLLEKLEVARTGAKALADAGIEVVLLEKLRAQLSLSSKLGAVLGMLMPKLRLRQLPGSRRKPDDEAVVLFTSGTEGAPKGVVLSQRNLMSNVAQILCRITVEPNDKLLNSLPVFHCFGMMGGVLLPVAGGIPSVQVPSPLLYKEIPEMIAAHNISIIFSTSTFFGQYAHRGEASMFKSLRLIIAGGEKLQETVAELWRTKLSKEILEAYGVTESAPGLAISTKEFSKTSCVGLPLASVRTRLIPKEGIEVGGSLQVAGPNIMLGYMYADNPGEIVPPADGWHDTGDIVCIDPDGFIRLVGRLRRFAKIAGEMVPLTQVETIILPALMEGEHGAVVSVPDERRGEQLVFVTTDAAVSREKLQQLLREASLPELWAPRRVQLITDFPLLPTGKTDYPALAALLEQAT